ncbi:MAG TPA: hypothetical protein DD381_13580 [Lentisphaeria bacterium]|nr:MAG: hypothetical protein A2X47_03895 [Lentisphaerae bacterium GWF2_38_69]HBM17353.1 hypothetical protein [Lentisphaeria bacterium]
MSDSALKLYELIESKPEKVRALLNILIESPYFYLEDSEELFRFLNHHRKEFEEFFKVFYGWDLIMDSKCARVYKDKWYNDKISSSGREQFHFSKRDECIGFMCLLNFYEDQLVENNMSAEDKMNLKFRFGDFLKYCHNKFNGLFPENEDIYSAEYIRKNVLKPIMSELEKYRFIKLWKPDSSLGSLKADDYIYEALPALSHYNAARLSQALLQDLKDDSQATDINEESHEEPEENIENSADLNEGEGDRV